MPKKVAIKEDAQKINYDEVLSKIKKVKEKIHLRERYSQAFAEEEQATVKENEKIIQAKRAENQLLREELQKSLNQEQEAISKLFTHRPKRECLALKRFSVQEAKSELDQTVCNLERSLNKFIHIKNQKACKIREMQNMPKFVNKNALGVEYATRSRQVENSMDKVALKTTTAQNIQTVYQKVKKSLEDELRFLPRKLDELERDKLDIAHEFRNMNTVHTNALMEADKAMKEKLSCENEVRSERRERENTLRKLRKRVKDIEHFVDEQQHITHHIMHRRVSRTASGEYERLAQKARRTEERLDKIAQYKKQAEMLEEVTGIPFASFDEILHCLSSQLNSTNSLKNLTTQKVKKLNKMRFTKGDLQNELDEMMFNSGKKLEEQIKALEIEVTQKKDEVIVLQRESSKKRILMEDMITCCDALLGHIIRATANLSVRVATPLKREDEKKTDILSGFKACIAAIETVYASAEERMSGRQKYDVFMMIPDDSEQSVMINCNNNRIPGQLERRISEEFDSYGGLKNDQYVSREFIKRRAENPTPISRAGRR